MNAQKLVKVGAVMSFWSGFHPDLHQLHQLFWVHKKSVQCIKKVQVGAPCWCKID